MDALTGDGVRRSDDDGASWPLVGPAPEAAGSRHVVLEALTSEERDAVVGYLKEHYANRLTAIFSASPPPISSILFIMVASV